MDILDSRLIQLRKNIKTNKKEIIHNILQRNTENCIFCGSSINLTKEHVLPKWVFENNPNKGFVTNINGKYQKYINTTLPACFECNSVILGELEKYIKEIISNINLNERYFDDKEINILILWLEIIDYKFQILNIYRKFLSCENGEFIPFLKDYPILYLDKQASLSRFQIEKRLRKSLERIGRKGKQEHKNSLVIFKTKNKENNFFHTMNDFIFIEFYKNRIAIFYFYDRFLSEIKAYQEAIKIIKEVYE